MSGAVLTQDVRIYQRISDWKLIFGQKDTMTSRSPRVHFNAGPMRISAACGAKKLTSEPPDAQSESFSLLFQQHVPSYYKIHVEAGTMFLIFHTRGDKVNMQESEDRYQTRRVIAN